MAEPLLAVRNLEAWYGESHILHGMTFDVQPGKVTTLLGHNGVGKTTTLKSIIGIVGKRTGSIIFEGKETIRLASNRIGRMGIAFCPEERGIFSSLTVAENLVLPPIVRDGGLSLTNTVLCTISRQRTMHPPSVHNSYSIFRSESVSRYGSADDYNHPSRITPE